MTDPKAALCPETARGACPARPVPTAPLPASPDDRAAILVLRYVAAARETGDAACWDAALDQAEAAFGLQRGPLIVGCAGALMRRIADRGIAFYPPPCGRLSAGEVHLLGLLRARPEDRARHGPVPALEQLTRLAQSLGRAEPLSAPGA